MAGKLDTGVIGYLSTLKADRLRCLAPQLISVLLYYAEERIMTSIMNVHFCLIPLLPIHKRLSPKAVLTTRWWED